MVDWDELIEKLIPLGDSADTIINFIIKYKWYIIGGIVVFGYVLLTQI